MTLPPTASNLPSSSPRSQTAALTGSGLLFTARRPTTNDFSECPPDAISPHSNSRPYQRNVSNDIESALKESKAPPEKVKQKREEQSRPIVAEFFKELIKRYQDARILHETN